MRLAAVNWKYPIRAVLLAAFFLTATQIGFNIGYASGAGQAQSKARAENRLFYQSFIDKLKSGRAFKLWSLRVVPVNKNQLNICKDDSKWIGAGSAEDFNIRNTEDK